MQGPTFWFVRLRVLRRLTHLPVSGPIPGSAVLRAVCCYILSACHTTRYALDIVAYRFATLHFGRVPFTHTTRVSCGFCRLLRVLRLGLDIAAAARLLFMPFAVATFTDLVRLPHYRAFERFLPLPPLFTFTFCITVPVTVRDVLLHTAALPRCPTLRVYGLPPFHTFGTVRLRTRLPTLLCLRARAHRFR